MEVLVKSLSISLSNFNHRDYFTAFRLHRYATLTPLMLSLDDRYLSYLSVMDMTTNAFFGGAQIYVARRY